MKDGTKERGGAALALCLVLIAVISLGALALVMACGRARIVPIGGETGSAFATKTALSWGQDEEIDPTRI